MSVIYYDKGIIYSNIMIVDSIYFHFISYFYFLSIYFSYLGLKVRNEYDIIYNYHKLSHT